MQKKQRFFLLTFFLFFLMLTSANAASPLWTFTPQTQTAISVPKNGTAQIIYLVQNQSPRAKTLIMKPVPGISQNAACHLAPKGNCLLTLTVKGSTLQGNVEGGPVLCQQGSNIQCYQPSPAGILHIQLVSTPPIQQFTVTPSAGANGSISPSTPQVVNVGSSITFTATPNSGYEVVQWLLDGSAVQSGGNLYQLTNIQANHTVSVTFAQAILTPLIQDLALSMQSATTPTGDPALIGNPRIIQVQNTGTVSATNVQVSTSGLPTGTSITNNTCTGTLNAGATCNITITPGTTASADNSSNACTTSPGTTPVAGTVTISADDATSPTVNVLVLGYGCIYQGGFLFAVDDTTPNTGSIGGKVSALTNSETTGLTWANVNNITTATSITDGITNTSALTTPAGDYPAAQACIAKNDQGFTDWYLPAICELGRYSGSGGSDAGCGNTYPTLYGLGTNSLGNLSVGAYWSSTQFSTSPTNSAWGASVLSGGTQLQAAKTISLRVRCVRAFTP